jgi:MFS transporter, DHA2 family, multidrug resistance protein
MFLQTLLGYTAETAGIATAPRGIGSMIAMPIAGVLLAYVDARLLMSGGIACLAAST